MLLHVVKRLLIDGYSLDKHSTIDLPQRIHMNANPWKDEVFLKGNSLLQELNMRQCLIRNDRNSFSGDGVIRR